MTRLLLRFVNTFSSQTIPCPEKMHSAILSGSENTLAQLLSQSKEENKQLRQELTDAKCRLHDACSDLKVCMQWVFIVYIMI